jgi:hypothetical protein
MTETLEDRVNDLECEVIQLKIYILFLTAGLIVAFGLIASLIVYR